jgi:hypothetical protein
LVRKSEEKRPLQTPRCRWENNIKIDLTKTIWEGVDWIHLTEDMVKQCIPVNVVMNVRVP